MSSSNPITVHEIIADGVKYWQNKNWYSSSLEFACYEWLQEAYPDIFKEFIAVMEVARES